MIKYSGVLLFLFASQAFGQVKLFYTATGEISIAELATHSRVSRVDPVKKTFKGYVAEFDTDNRLFLELNYDSSGVKNGNFKYNRFGFTLEGVFKNNQASVSVPDSILTLLVKKEQFFPGVYIRKRDYPEIKTVLSPPAPSTDSVVVNEQVYRIVEEAPSFPGGQPFQNF